ncbi:MAG: glyoxalase [Actinobacteria bacterium]|nr:glyoxalase [Actinomycetota bacterium]
MSFEIDEIVLAEDAAAWAAAGFRVDEGHCDIGTVRLVLAGRETGRGLIGWSVRGELGDRDLDGLRPSRSEAPSRPSAPAHPNSVTAIDHLVAFTPDRDRTVAAVEAAGLPVRRIRDEPSPGGAGGQAFFRLGDVVLEVIEYGGDSPRAGERGAPARLWGLALTVDSLERAAGALGDDLGEPRDAVQPGRRIATIRRSAGFSIPIALMTHGPRAA